MESDYWTAMLLSQDALPRYQTEPSAALFDRHIAPGETCLRSDRL